LADLGFNESFSPFVSIRGRSGVGMDFRVPLEQDILLTGEGTVYLDGRQTAFHLIK